MSLRLRTATLDERGLTFLGRDGSLTLGPDGVLLASTRPVEHTDRWLNPTTESTEPVLVPWPDVREVAVLLPETALWRYRVYQAMTILNPGMMVWYQATTELSVRWRLQGAAVDLGRPPGRPNRRGDARMAESALMVLGERALLPALADRALLETLLAVLGGTVRHVPIVRALVARRRAYRLVVAWALADDAGRRAMHRPVRTGTIGVPSRPHEVLAARFARATGLVVAGLAVMIAVAALLLDDDGSARPGVPELAANILFGLGLAIAAGGGLALVRVAVTLVVQRAGAARRRAS